MFFFVRTWCRLLFGCHWSCGSFPWTSGASWSMVAAPSTLLKLRMPLFWETPQVILRPSFHWVGLDPSSASALGCALTFAGLCKCFMIAAEHSMKGSSDGVALSGANLVLQFMKLGVARTFCTPAIWVRDLRWSWQFLSLQANCVWPNVLCQGRWQCP